MGLTRPGRVHKPWVLKLGWRTTHSEITQYEPSCSGLFIKLSKKVTKALLHLKMGGVVPISGGALAAPICALIQGSASHAPCP